MSTPSNKRRQTTQAQTPINVDIVSDIVCPWCWLGKRYFDQAVKKSGLPVNVTWRPYMLDPNVPEQGTAYRDYMRAKFGDTPDNRFKVMREHLEQAAPKAGITYRFSDIPKRPNTLRAHQLVRWASGQGKGSAAKEALFKAFFDELRDIGDIAVLTDIAKALGMDSDLVEQLLNEGRDAEAIKEEIAFFAELGVSSVPTFIYNGQFALSGAQESAAHINALRKALTLPPET